MYKKHTDLSPGTPHLEGLLENLPDTLEDDEVMIACYAHQEGQIMVVGYYKTKGYYEGRIAYPDGFRGDISVSDCVYSLKAKEVCKRDDCWAGGDTGDFYYNETMDSSRDGSWR